MQIHTLQNFHVQQQSFDEIPVDIISAEITQTSGEKKKTKEGITKTFHLLLFTTKRAFQNPQLSLIHYTPKQPILFYITAGERGIGGKSHQMFVWQIFRSKMEGDKKAEKARYNINQIGPEEVPKSLAMH